MNMVFKCDLIYTHHQINCHKLFYLYDTCNLTKHTSVTITLQILDSLTSERITACTSIVDIHVSVRWNQPRDVFINFYKNEKNISI